MVAAMVVAQRQRERLRQQQAVLVARAHEEERAWVAGELHDDVLQRIALVRAELESLWGDRSAPDAADTAAPLSLDARLQGVNTELVDLAVAVRAIATRMHPTVVDQVGLLPALQSLKGEVERGSGLAVTLEIRGGEPTPPLETARAAYRIVQEALRNVIRHAQATAATVTVELNARHVHLVIQDNGRGFEASLLKSQGLGLASLRERAIMVGGRAEVKSRPGAGTTIDVVLPV
ncbi:MAG: hypothetical protein IT357_10835 [Gemmatimonadaceae bacterium]|nr:hypothetical protein [Gemmatimonadaceae bacterium]